MPNRLAGETSPYLLQHAANPVDWYPWGPEALERARHEDKPILLSIGYAACHWCHVMAHESFEDEATARLMNDRFVNIKVDREERPDLDWVYMQAVQSMTGHGGWPMTVFLTPAGEPFYGGTYFPPTDRHGMPSFRRVLESVSGAWRSKRDAVDATAGQLREMFARLSTITPHSAALSRQTFEAAYRRLVRSFDPVHAGFGGAPKFPPTMTLDFLLRHWARSGASPALDMAAQTFRAMVQGGIFDQVGGGLHRYSVDEQWLVPHFEKMLYDNALLVRLGVHLWQATHDQQIRDAVEATIDWALREMRADQGGFYSSLDADSEGEEGRFYVWSRTELDELLGPDAEAVAEYWGVRPDGNFEGRNILHIARTAAVGSSTSDLAALVSRARTALLQARDERIRPSRDDKILAGWNGIMVGALAEAARVLGRPVDRAAAEAGGEFLWTHLVRAGRAQRLFKDGVVKGPGYLEDQAAVGLAFLDLYQLTFDRAWFERASVMAAGAVEWYYDEASGLFFDSPRDHEQLVMRPRDPADNATPSGNSLVADLLFRMAEFSGSERYRSLATGVVGLSAEAAAQYPSAFGYLLGVAEGLHFGAVEVALAGTPGDTAFEVLVRSVSGAYVPSLVLAGGRSLGADDPVVLLRDRSPAHATGYVCRRFVCDLPTSDPAQLLDQLARARTASSP